MQTKYRRLVQYLVAIFVAAVATVALAAFVKPENSGSARLPDGTSETLMAVEIPDETPQIMVDYTGFRVSFNPAHRQPNYAAWELTGEEAEGQEPRDSRFAPDNDVYGCPSLDDYRNSGYDRGHMAPAADMKWSRQAMLDCHFLTNICPQNHGLNGGRWNSLEQACRRWAKRDSALVIIAGPILSDRITETIGRGQVSVPKRFFKVILAPYVDSPRAIAFVMPNTPTRDGLESMAMTVDQLEQITGFDFFSALPDSIEHQIESSINFHKWTAR